MNKYSYKKGKNSIRKILRIISFISLITGISIILYVFFPLLSWQIFFADASREINYPIPKTTVIEENQLTTLVSTASRTISGVDYTNASNWFPSLLLKKEKVDLQYTISIPSIGIKNATVSTSDNDLTKHLVNYGDTIPSEKGNAVIFGHSTLPQLFNQNNYKTIFANAYKIKVGDEIFTTVSKVTYKYKIEKVFVVDPSQTWVLAQDYSDKYLTLVTCTPPGTVWKRLIIKGRLEKI